MTSLPETLADGSGAAGAGAPPGRWPLVRWFVASATLGVPQAAGPVAFSLVALSLTGDAGGGAALILAMTLAQMAGAVPIARLGRGRSSAGVLRRLMGVRAAALAAMALLAGQEAPFGALVVLAAVAGSVNGAAFGHLRALLNGLAPASRLPRALGIAATLNEVTFVLGPVLAVGLGTVSPAFAVLALAALGAVPALVVPDGPAAPADERPTRGGRVLGGPILLWLACAAAGSATVAAVEIGAVALALRFGHAPALAILFTVPLCLAAVAGGVWTSVRNRASTRPVVLAQLALMATGAALAALGLSLAATVAGAVLIGAVLAPLATHYSLVLDRLAPPGRRPEVFALLRTANALGVVLASGALTLAPLGATLALAAGLMALAVLAVALAPAQAAASRA